MPTNPAAPRVPPKSVQTRDSISRKLADFAKDPAKYAGTVEVTDPKDPKENDNGDNDSTN